MEQILEPVETPSSVFLYRHQQKVICNDNDKLREILGDSLFESHENQHLTIDWEQTYTHPLILEFNLDRETERVTTDFWMRFFDLVFLNKLSTFINLPEITLLLTMSRSRTKGLRIHFVGLEISHDDYSTLYNLIRDIFHYEENNLNVRLENPSTFPLPSCDRPDGTGDLHMPVRLVRVAFQLHQEDGVWKPHCLENITWREPDHSFFEKMVNHVSLWKGMVRGMMPIPQKNATYVHFPTQIVKRDKNRHVAQFKSFLNGEIYNVEVYSDVLVKGEPFAYNFLKQNAPHIDLIHAWDPLFTRWYSMFRQATSPLRYCQEVDIKLRQMCPHLKDEPSPLAAVLRAYERPVYYALCNYYNYSIEKFREDFPFLSNDVPSTLPEEASRLTFDTILYCAYRTGEGSMLTHMTASFDWILANTTTYALLLKNILWFQKTVFPIALTKEKRDSILKLIGRDNYPMEFVHFWDPILEKWTETQDNGLKIESIYRSIVEHLHQNFKISPELEKALEDTHFIVEGIFDDINQQHAVPINIRKRTEDYGTNVPEYYFMSET